MGMTKYIVVQQDRTGSMAAWLEKRLGVKVERLGWTDGSTTTSTLRIRTKKTEREVCDAIWERFMEADVREKDPREKNMRMGTWYD